MTRAALTLLLLLAMAATGQGTLDDAWKHWPGTRVVHRTYLCALHAWQDGDQGRANYVRYARAFGRLEITRYARQPSPAPVCVVVGHGGGGRVFADRWRCTASVNGRRLRAVFTLEQYANGTGAIWDIRDAGRPKLKRPPCRGACGLAPDTPGITTPWQTIGAWCARGLGPV